MANVYRRKDSENWTADLVDHHGRRWRVSLYTAMNEGGTWIWLSSSMVLVSPG